MEEEGNTTMSTTSKQEQQQPIETVAEPTLFPALSIPTRLHADSHYSGKGVCIAMIDSGFVPHPDLIRPTNRILAYYDAVEQTEAALPPTDVHLHSWHGTMTACTAAGNGFLSRGVYASPAGNAQVVLIRTMNDDGKIPTAVIVTALQWCKENHERYGIGIVNLSVYADEHDHSSEHPVTQLVEELVAAGVVVVAASGNNPAMPLRPPATAPSALTVGGLDDKNTLLDEQYTLYHSSYGKAGNGIGKPELIAPAIWLPAPILPGTTVQTEAAALCALDAMTDDMVLRTLPLLITSTKLSLELLKETDATALRTAVGNRIRAEKIISPFYKHVDGTSFAAPIVCSVIAQMLEANPHLVPQQIKDVLISTADFMKGLPRERQGYGRVDAAAALQMALRIR